MQDKLRCGQGVDWQLEVVGPVDTITLQCPPMSISVQDLFAGLVPFES